jgi:hypothetical protein
MTFPPGNGVAVGPPIGVGVFVGGFAACEIIGGVPTIRATRKSIGTARMNTITIFLFIVFVLSVVFLPADEEAGFSAVRVVGVYFLLATSLPSWKSNFLQLTCRIRKRKT